MLAVPLLALLVAGCSSADRSDEGPGPTPATSSVTPGLPTPSASSPATGPPPPSVSAPAPPPPTPRSTSPRPPKPSPSRSGPKPGDPATPVTVRGRLSLGVEPGCLLLVGEPGGTYQIIGGDRSVLRPGRRVEVSGTLRPGVASTCQQGVPLTVTKAKVV